MSTLSLQKNKVEGFVEWDSIPDEVLSRELFMSRALAVHPKTDARIYFPKRITSAPRHWFSVWEPTGNGQEERFLFRVFGYAEDAIIKASQRYTAYLVGKQPALAS